MKWLARLKKIEIALEVDATEPTKPGFVGFVAPFMTPTQTIGGDSPAANNPAQVSGLVACGAVTPLVTGATAVRKQLVRTETPVPSGKVSRRCSSPSAVANGPDRSC